MTLDPQIQQMLGAFESMGTPSIASGTPATAREVFGALSVNLRPAEAVVPVAAVEDLQLPGPTGHLHARIYRPEAAAPVPRSSSSTVAASSSGTSTPMTTSAARSAGMSVPSC